MTVLYGVLAIVGVILLVIVWCIWFLRTEQKRIEKSISKGVWYDERQIAAHGKAFRFSTSVASVYFLVCYIFFKVWQFQECEPKIEPALLTIGGVWLAYVSYHFCCLMTDSALPLGNYSFPAFGYIIGGVLNILSAMLSMIAVGASFSGKGSETWERVITGIALFAIGVIHIIARSCNRRGTE